MSNETNLAERIIEKNEAQRYTLGVVYEPDTVDAQGDFAEAPEIEKAAWAFMQKLQAGNELTGTAVKVLSALVENQDAKVDVTELWERVEKGRLGDMHSDWPNEIGTVVESYIAPVDMQIGEETVKRGTWLLGTVWSPEYFAKVQNGERVGLSLGGRAWREKVDA